VIRALRGTFNISPRAEITIEVNPETATAELLGEIRTQGVNRLSIGVQSFDDTILRTLGRVHDSATAGKAIDLAFQSGYENVGIDLMFGIPGQTVKIWQDTLKQAMAKNPMHISAYGLTIEHGTPYDKMIAKGELVLPDNETQAEMYQAMCATLTTDGYNRYEVSNFARLGFECQHNFKYWKDDKYLGLGPSAHSYDGDRRTANVKNLDKYVTSLKKGKSPINFKEQLTDEQKAEERLLLGLRLAEGIDYNIIREVVNEQVLAELKSDGYLTTKLNNLVLTDKGFLVADDIIVKLLKK
jgi:oxygen-independent coproporphyrinogen III oxidase